MILKYKYDGCEYEGILNITANESNAILSLYLPAHKINLQAFGDNYFSLLSDLRQNLLKDGIVLLCNGASLKVYPSSMQFDFDGSDRAYFLQMGKHGDIRDIVYIFDYDENKYIECTVEQQIDYYNRWVLSKKKQNPKQSRLSIENIDPNGEFIFFWGHQSSNNNEITKSCFSQWWPCNFIYEGINYTTTEQWMMAEKARIFSDRYILEEILQAHDPKLIKELGRRISFFDEEVWNIRKYDVVYEGNLLKFSQNESLKAFLLSTKNKIIVEASPYDNIWGIGMKQQDEGIHNPKNWRGQNLLGFALMEVRQAL